MAPARKVIVLGDGYVARNTIASLVSKNSSLNVEAVAGVSNPDTFEPGIDGVTVILADMSNKESLSKTLKDRNYDRAFLVLPGHCDRLVVGWQSLAACYDAGIPQVVLISILTADSPRQDRDAARENQEESFHPLEDDVENLGAIPVSHLQRSSVSSSMSSFSKSEIGTPSFARVRVQTRHSLHGWFPMKIKILQISLPHVTPSCKTARPPPVNTLKAPAGISFLEKQLEGAYFPNCPNSTQEYPKTSSLLAFPLARGYLLRQHSLSLPPPERPASPCVDSAHLLLAQETSTFPPLQSQSKVPAPQRPIEMFPIFDTADSHYTRVLQSLQQQKRKLLQKPCPWL